MVDAGRLKNMSLLFNFIVANEKKTYRLIRRQEVTVVFNMFQKYLFYSWSND
jgi:hypothetical protein